MRPAWTELADTVADRGRVGLNQLRSVVHSLIDNDGITYTEVDPHRDGATGASKLQGVEPRPWRLDTLPLVVSAADWEVLEAGLVQRSRLLDAVLADLYGPRSLVTEGVIPPELVFAHPGYVRAANGVEVPGHHQLFMHACDVSRLPDGSFAVNADWTQAPSGAGYALADRRVVAHAIPELYERIAPRPTTPFAQALRLALDRRCTRCRSRPGGGGAQPGHLLGDGVRSGVSRYAAGFSAGGKRGSGGARRQAVDALAGHAETR